MQCEKTGAIVYLEQYGEYVLCDAYFTSHAQLFVWGVSRTRENPRDYVDYTIKEIDGHPFEHENRMAIFAHTYVRGGTA